MTIREECVSHTLFLCMMHEISIPYTVISSAARNLFRFPFPSSFAKPFRGSTVPAFPAIQCFPFLAVGHAPSYRQRKRSLDFARDDVAEVAFSQHTLYTERGLSIPPYRHFERSREIFLALRAFLLLSKKVSPFPLSHIRRYTGVQKRSRASLGMTLREYRSLTLPIYFPCNNDTREAPSTFAALLFFMRRTTPLNPEP